MYIVHEAKCHIDIHVEGIIYSNLHMQIWSGH
jgi:hypothetical protein